MKRKRDKKYLLTIGTCGALLVFMLISLTNKKTYSYPECLGVVSADEKYCCVSSSSFSNNVLYNSKQTAEETCQNYALSKNYQYYTCNLETSETGMYQWIIITYNGCTE